MKIGTTFYTPHRSVWRAWLAKHHATASEIWLIYYKQGASKKRIPYHAAVEEALCYGWIDSTTKAIDAERYAQRFSPRRPGSVLSGLNKERILRLIASKKMRKAGMTALAHHLDANGRLPEAYTFPKDILAAIRKNRAAWQHYQKFPLPYRRIRVAWIDGARDRPSVFRTRLRYFITKCERNERFGMER
ncbi:MAG: YdeI/OmpD-associated family protein [Bacteroidetes bacterium]|nr:YdeI/OmpD-associated family protein [Bacteroidota bacterium]